jgi:fatty-acyl-CoA synthase
LLGAQRAGLVPSPFAPPSSAARLTDDMRAYSRALRAGNCRALLIDEAMRQRLGAALDRLDVPILQIEQLEAADAGSRKLEIAPEITEDDRRLALVQYTSGSTSHPKGVGLSHAQLAAGISVLVEGARFTAEDINGQWLPVHHDMGLIGSLTGVALGSDQYFWSPLTFVRDPARWLEQFAARKATVYAGPSFSYAEMTARCTDEQRAALDLSAWRIAFNGAEPVDPQVLRRFCAKFAGCGLRADVVTPVYGLAEITLAATVPALGTAWRSRRVDAAHLGPGAKVRDQADGREVVSVGAVAPGHQLRIQLDGGTRGDDEVGEIQLRGPAMMSEYYRDPEATAEAFEDGWLRTGDLGFVNNGELYVIGRSKELMILHGKNYYPQDVEEIVQDQEGCHRRMAVAFASSDPRGEHIVAVIETRLSEPQACEQLALASQRAVRAALSIPRLEIILVRPGSIPRTTSGKRQRLLVRTTVAQNGFRDAVVWSTDVSQNPGELS